jgi:hypothetical protein
LGLPISPDLLRWWVLEVPKYVGAPTALNIRQTRQTVDPGQTINLALPPEFRYCKSGSISGGLQPAK